MVPQNQQADPSGSRHDAQEQFSVCGMGHFLAFISYPEAVSSFSKLFHEASSEIAEESFSHGFREL